MPRRKMSADHKQAMAKGRAEGRSVKGYLDALEQHRPRRGRPRTAESVRRRLGLIEKELSDASSLKRLQLVQERRNLQAELARAGDKADLAKLEVGFVKVARAYGKRKGISYGAWRELGVPAEVLGRAGIARGG